VGRKNQQKTEHRLHPLLNLRFFEIIYPYLMAIAVVTDEDKSGAWPYGFAESPVDVFILFEGGPGNGKP
jgi:hypothetical protein